MRSVIRPAVILQMQRLYYIACATVCGYLLFIPAVTGAADAPGKKDVGLADAKTEAQMKPYTDAIANTEVTFDLVPIPGGKFVMGSPDSEAGRKDDEGPRHEIEIDPFWMGKCEVTWNEYEIWTFSLDIQR